jgi:hypothetical protein
MDLSYLSESLEAELLCTLLKTWCGRSDWNCYDYGEQSR